MTCCEKWKKELREADPDRHVGWEYYHAGRNWCLNGCCGGGCYVLMDVTHCPFCGETLPAPTEESET